MEKDEIQKLTYSEAVAELEKIVREMQSDACSIDNLSRLTSRSLELLKVCKAKLLSTDEELKKQAEATIAALRRVQEICNEEQQKAVSDAIAEMSVLFAVYHNHELQELR